MNCHYHGEQRQQRRQQENDEDDMGTLKNSQDDECCSNDAVFATDESSVRESCLSYDWCFFEVTKFLNVKDILKLGRYLVFMLSTLVNIKDLSF